MSNKNDDLSKAREKRRQKTGWTIQEIKERATKDFIKNKNISKDNPEPENFYSGDMKKFLEDDTHDKDC